MSYLTEQLRVLVNDDNKWIINKVKNIKEDPDGAKRWLKDLSKNDIEHARNVEVYLGKIVKESGIKLTPEEIYLLIYAIYTHDVGYRIEPANHPQKSFEEIKSNSQSFFIQDEDLATAIAFVGLTHGIDDLNQIPTEFNIDFLNKTESFDLRFLGSLLRLADDIDEGYLRVESRINQENNTRNRVYHVEIGPQVIRLKTRPKSKEEWIKLNETKNHIQSRIDEIRPIIYPKGIKIDKIELFPESWKEYPFESSKTTDPDDYETNHIPNNGSKSEYVDVGIRSFLRDAEYLQDETDEMLCLIEFFDGRYIKKDYSWNNEIFNELNEFISQNITPIHKYRIHLITHTSIAFLAGYLLDSKTGVEIYPMQTTSSGREFWSAKENPDGNYNKLKIYDEIISTETQDIALVLGISRDILTNVKEYIQKQQINVSKIISCTVEGCIGNDCVINGKHAKKLATNIGARVDKRSEEEKKNNLHIFAACPGGLMFYLGQISKSFRNVILYEYDFEGLRGESYSKSFELPIRLEGKK